MRSTEYGVTVTSRSTESEYGVRSRSTEYGVCQKIVYFSIYLSKYCLLFICQKIVYFLKSEPYMLIGSKVRINKKVAKGLGRLRRIRDLVPINALVYTVYIYIYIYIYSYSIYIDIYSSIILPHFDYCSSVHVG
jgi:hypothetical protein